MSLEQNLLVIVLLLGIFILVYCKIKNVTIIEFFKEIFELFKS